MTAAESCNPCLLGRGVVFCGVGTHLLWDLKALLGSAAETPIPRGRRVGLTVGGSAFMAAGAVHLLYVAYPPLADPFPRLKRYFEGVH